MKSNQTSRILLHWWYLNSLCPARYSRAWRLWVALSRGQVPRGVRIDETGARLNFEPVKI